MMRASGNETSITPLHMLTAIAKERGSFGETILRAHRVGDKKLASLLPKKQGRHKPKKSPVGHLSSSCKRTLTRAVLAAWRGGSVHVGTEHLLFGAIAEPEIALPETTKKYIRGHLEEIFRAAQPLKEETRRDHQGKQKRASPPPEKRVFPEIIEKQSERQERRALEYFCDDLTARANAGTLGELVGREHELQRLIQTLSRKTKNNVLLIGDPGVGKTALAHGIAAALAQGRVAESLAEKRLFSLDLGLLVSGTVFRGEFEARLKDLFHEAVERKIILFIDEVHTIIGAGAAQGALDAANLLKPLLLHDDVRVIGATSQEEYRRSIERDPALARRFQIIHIREESTAGTLAILKTLKAQLETHHSIAISEGAVKEAVRLASSALPDRFLPDKAIDLLDEAAARLACMRIPNEQQRQRTLLKHEYESAIGEKERAVTQEDFERALHLQKKAESIAQTLEELAFPSQDVEAKQQLHAEDVSAMFAELTGLSPLLAGTTADEARSLAALLRKRVVAQEEVIRSVAQVLARAQSTLRTPHKPFGSFLFLGPSGVGKTELARALAAFFGSRSTSGETRIPLIRFDMSEFAESHSIARLLGAPPGYIGYEESGELVKRVREQKKSVVLFDEIEKAHPQLFHVLLQILDEGHLTGQDGRRVDFTSTCIVLTSNIGTQEFTKASTLGFNSPEGGSREAYETLREQTFSEVRRILQPELLNRIDGMFVFRPLDKTAIEKIVLKQLKELEKRASENHRRKIRFAVSHPALEILIRKAFVPKEGARRVARTLDRFVAIPLSNLLRQRPKIRTVEITAVRGKIVLTPKE